MTRLGLDFTFVRWFGRDVLCICLFFLIGMFLMYFSLRHSCL